ncbi:hypothetical protein G6F56_011895 [Rhizopus delemar]|nr:hypothetical protein G6F56_011895 [Rhizopus delemar]
MSTDTFHGWAAVAKDQPLEWTELPLRTADDYSVDMDITHCGICGSDVHIQDSGWGPTDYPCVTGHEIVGVCTAVGKKVKNVKVGDRIGVGAQSGSCHEFVGPMVTNHSVVTLTSGEVILVLSSRFLKT